MAAPGNAVIRGANTASNQANDTIRPPWAAFCILSNFFHASA
jgi:hypothetical protein